MPCGQSFYCICHIENHHVSLCMMPHQNFEHCGRLYIDFLFFVALLGLVGNRDGRTQSARVGCCCIWLSGPGFQDLDICQSRSLFSSSLLSSVLLLLFSRLQQRSAPPPGHAPLVLGTALLLQATLRPCWEPENGRARSTRAGDQRAGRPSVTDPSSVTDRRSEFIYKMRTSSSKQNWRSREAG